MWDNGTAFDFRPSFRQWETDACKVATAFTYVVVNQTTGELVDIQKKYGNFKANMLIESMFAPY